ncbi:MAG TPA: hypothetical protein VM577_21570 [Anaerovoracaceae bacterium]|nr:hypothetical protein [Anaerovoracaceae bacterium]
MIKYMTANETFRKISEEKHQTVVNISSDTLKEVLGQIVNENDDIFVIIEKIIRSAQKHSEHFNGIETLGNLLCKLIFILVEETG